MSTNFLLSNNGLPVLSSQQLITPHRTRAVSACSNPAIPVVSHYHPTFSQSFQPIAPVDGSWAHTQQGVYVNGMGKFVYPGGNITEVDDMVLNQSSEPYKYAHGVKVPGVGPQTGAHFFQPPPAIAGNHGQISTQVPLGVSVAPNGVPTHSQGSVPSVAGPLRTEPLNMLHTLSAHQVPASAQSMFVPGLVGQQTMPPHQNTISHSPFIDNPSNTIGSFSGTVKHMSNLNGSNGTRLAPGSLPNAHAAMTHPNYCSGLTVAQHQAVPHHQQPPIFPNSSLPPPHLPSGLPPPGMVEFLPPAIFGQGDPNAQSQFTQHTSGALFGSYTTQLGPAYESSTLPVDVSFNARVRHNTWSGLESTVPVRSADQHLGSRDKVIPLSGSAFAEVNRTIAQRSNALDAFGSTFVSTSSSLPFPTSQVTSLFAANTPRPGLMELPGTAIYPNRSFQHQRDVGLNHTLGTRFARSNKPTDASATQQLQWSAGLAQSSSHWPIGQPQLENGLTTTVTISESDSNRASSTAQPRITQRSSFDNGIYRKGAPDVKFPGVLGDREQPVNDLDVLTRFVSDKMHGSTNGSQFVQSSPHQADLRSCSVRHDYLEPDGVRSARGQLGGLAVSNFQAAGWNTQAAPIQPLNFPFRSPNPPGVRLNPDAWHPQAFPFTSHPPLIQPGVDQANSGNGIRRQKLSQSGRYFGPTDVSNVYLARMADPVGQQVPPWLNGLRDVLDACPTRVLISTILVGAVIGRGGRTIRWISSKTGAQIDFKPETVAFTQFSIRRSSRNSGKVASTETATNTASHSVDSTPDAESTAPLTPPIVPPNQSDPGSQLNRSQVVFLTGSREQCSAALAEMLAVCFRECAHKGLPEPCLGLLVEHHVFNQFLTGRGQRYFKMVHMGTGAWVTVTGSPAQVQSIQNDPKRRVISAKCSTDSSHVYRILVFRGQLAGIRALEAQISENLRFATAELLVPSSLWPLLPYLPVSSLLPPTSTASSSDTRLNHCQRDLHTVSSLIMSIAEAFWPQSVSDKLKKHLAMVETVRSSNFGLLSNIDAGKVRDEGRRRRRSKPNCVPPNTIVSVDPEVTTTAGLREDGANEESNEHQTAASVTEGAVGAAESATSSHQIDFPTSSNSETVEHNLAPVEIECDLSGVEQNPGSSSSSSPPRCPSTQPYTEEPTSNTRVTDLDNGTGVDSSRGTLISEADLALATAIQQSLVAVVGPAAWLATSGMLYMRVSYNEAGVLIGAGGYRVHQLMQSTGAEVHIGKTPISGPYALNQSRRPNQAISAPVGLKSEPVVQPDDSERVVDGIMNSDMIDAPDEVVADQIQPSYSVLDEANLEHPSSDLFQVSPHTCSAPPEPQGLKAGTSEEADLQPVLDGSSVVDNATSSRAPSCESLSDKVNNPLTDAVPDDSEKSPCVHSQSSLPNTDPEKPISVPSVMNTYRLVTLSGPFQSQLMAQWRIFQRLRSLHNRESVHKTAEPSQNDANDSSHPSIVGKATLRLATLVCLPYRFLCWLTSNNTGFADFMCSSASSHEHNPWSVEASSPLTWLQSQATRQMQIQPDTNVKVIHVLPEPRRRRRLMQQQLRRAGATRRGLSSVPVHPKPVLLPTVGLTHDGLDLLWSDPDRVPMEIYADYETTQIILAHVYHMLALWLYGQALENPSGLNFGPTAPPPSSLFLWPRQPLPGGGGPTRVFMPYLPNGLVCSRSSTAVDWPQHWQSADHAGLVDNPVFAPGRFGPSGHNPLPDMYHRVQQQQRPRLPGPGHKWPLLRSDDPHRPPDQTSWEGGLYSYGIGQPRPPFAANSLLPDVASSSFCPLLMPVRGAPRLPHPSRPATSWSSSLPYVSDRTWSNKPNRRPASGPSKPASSSSPCSATELVPQPTKPVCSMPTNTDEALVDPVVDGE
ncbi:hypothetical protein P879_04700 [Paragonimus westermani]|uniref:K Homology domain-containing protein n=1 Tax=Paragonimus westermani TaxID=34504 RepID=A0A8T0DTI1_9TREM|nr:hypothetical protein P879_04700 [Paragonimus westermani]